LFVGIKLIPVTDVRTRLNLDKIALHMRSGMVSGQVKALAALPLFPLDMNHHTTANLGDYISLSASTGI
jgi:hypothetical protein